MEGCGNTAFKVRHGATKEDAQEVQTQKLEADL